MMKRLPVFFISHGGGPWPWMPEMRESMRRTQEGLMRLGLEIRPRSILMISGHWEETEFTVATSKAPSMIYDYSGFPPHTYEVSYPAPGDPVLALKVKSLLQDGGFHVNEDKTRGFDHGTFVPLFCLYQTADIPVAQLSLKKNYSVQEHLQVGKLLGPLRDEGVLILGSGLSYHNLREMFRGNGLADSLKFDQWLSETFRLDSVARNERLKEWEKAPAARKAHPQEDHLIPLMVVAGAAGEDKGELFIQDEAFNVRMSSYRFG